MNPETLISRFIISEHFGNIVNKVCALLLAKGRLPFNSILSETKLPSQTIRSTLSILLQVGVVKYALADVGTRSITYYSALYLPILYRIRYHKYISITETIFSNTEADIISHLLVNGHSSLSVLLDLFPDRNSFEVLLKAKLIIQITPTSTLSTIDVVLQEEAKAFAEVGVPLSTLEKKKLRKRIADERDQEAQELAPVISINQGT